MSFLILSSSSFPFLLLVRLVLILDLPILNNTITSRYRATVLVSPYGKRTTMYVLVQYCMFNSFSNFSICEENCEESRFLVLLPSRARAKENIFSRVYTCLS